MTFPVPRTAALTSLALAMLSLTSSAHAEPDALQPSVLVTAARVPQSASDVLADYVIISAEELENSNQQSLIDVLQKQRGIEVARNGGPGSSSSVFIRGADSKQNIVLVDGVRIGSSTLGTANWSALPMANIDHVEIVYGPLSTLYGADAIGGVVQVFTKKGSGAPRVNAFAGAGSDATRSIQAGVLGSTGGTHELSYALGAGKEQSDGFSASRPGLSSYNPDRDGYTKDSASGQLGLVLAKGHELGLLFMHSRLDAQYDAGAAAYDARTQQQLANLTVTLKDQILPNWRSTLQIARANDESGTDSSAAASGKSHIETEQTGISWQHDFTFGADTLQLLVDRRKEKVLSSATAALNTERTTDSFAAAYLLKRGAHLASASVRNDDSSQYGSNTTGAIGYGYRISKAVRANASYGTSFRAPTFNDLYFPGFGVSTNKPEHGKNAEAGIYFDHGATQLSAVYYRNRLTDLLVSTSKCPVEAASHPSGCAYNVDHAVLSGLSMEARGQFGQVALRATADLQDPRDETTVKSLARRAKKHGSVGAEYGAGTLNAGVEVTVSGKRFDDAANKNVLGGYGLVNLYATWQFAPAWSVLARWDNAANKQYQLARNYATAGSKVFAGVRYAMK